MKTPSILRPLVAFFKPSYVHTIANTRYGAAMDVHGKLFGVTWRASDATFARYASRYIDSVQPPVARMPKPRSVPVRRALSEPKQLARVTTTPAPLARAASLPLGPSRAWKARCANMLLANTWADTPEVHTVAHLLDARIRVYTPDAQGMLALRHTANPAAASHELDLVLEHGHYFWVFGGMPSTHGIQRDQLADRLQSVPADGACFFHCAARGILGHTDAQLLRQVTVERLMLAEHDKLDGSHTTLGELI